MSRPRSALVAGISTALMFLSFPGVAAPQQDKEQGEQKVSLELVWEREFEEPVVDFLIGMAKAGHSFPKVVVLSSRVLIFDGSGSKVSEIKGLDRGSDYFAISESENHIVHSWQYASEHAKELEECVVYVYALSGSLLWKTKNIAPARFPKLAPNGEYMIGSAGAEILLARKDGTVKLINPRGIKRRQLARGFFAVSGDSKFWAISFGQPYRDESVQLVVYDPSGEELFRQIMEPMGLAYELEISNDGQFIGVIAPQKGTNLLHLFSSKGGLLWKTGGISRTNHWIVFSPANSHVLVADFGGDFKYFDTSSGKLVWHHHIPRDEIRLHQDTGIFFIPHMQATFSPDGHFVMVGGVDMRTNADRLLMFETESGFVATLSLPCSNGNLVPKTKFASATDYLYTACGKKLLKFALKIQE